MKLNEHVDITGDLDSGEIRLSARPRKDVKTGYIILPSAVSVFIWQILQSNVDATIDTTKEAADRE
jgi:hypothetical protein